MFLRRLPTPAILLALLAVLCHLSVSSLKSVNRLLLKPAPIERIERWPNPSRTLEVVVLTRNGGATVPYRTDLHIVPFGQSPEGEPLILADRVDNLTITWRSDHEVDARADAARIFRSQRQCLGGDLKETITVNLTVSRPLN